jgi:hypothetical protein
MTTEDADLSKKRFIVRMFEVVDIRSVEKQLEAMGNALATIPKP